MHRSPRAERVDERWLADHPLPDLADGDKYERGTVAIIGGAADTPGAVVLAGRAALRMGAGRLRIGTARTVALAVATTVPEAKVVGLAEDGDGGLLPDEDAIVDLVDGARVVLIGPGARSSTVARLVERTVAVADPATIVVLDAAAIAVLPTLAPSTTARLPGRLLLTPNHQEVALAVGHDGEEGAAELAARGAIVTCFGRIECPDGPTLTVDADGTGLGTSGSGDVLAGLVAGAASRSPDDLATAAAWATYAHSEAGRRLQSARRVGAYLAGELVDAVR